MTTLAEKPNSKQPKQIQSLTGSPIWFSWDVGLTVSHHRKVFSMKWEMEPVAAARKAQRKGKKPSPSADGAISMKDSVSVWLLEMNHCYQEGETARLASLDSEQGVGGGNICYHS